METRDFTPDWLKPKAVEIEVTFDDEPSMNELRDFLHSHQPVVPAVRRWTKAQLNKKKQRLLRQISKEESRIAEENALRDECIELEKKLESLRSHRSSVSFPKGG